MDAYRVLQVAPEAMLPPETATGPGPTPMPPPRSWAAGTRLSHGRYAGWALRDLARQDPDYLRWLSRHSSGIRYRIEIYQIQSKQESIVA